MERQRKLRILWIMLAWAAVLRLLFGGAFEQLLTLLTGEDMTTFLLYMNTGRLVTSAGAADPSAPEATVPAPTVSIPQPVLPIFTAADAHLADIHNETAYDPDPEDILLRPLQWKLMADAPTVLILHTHATESYTQSEGYTYTPSSQDRTLDKGYNMVRVGEHLAQLLRQAGIGVIHDTTLHDYPSYTGSYTNARRTIRGYLEDYPTIQLVLDLHRDAVELDDGTQLTTHTVLNGEETARLMMVVGTDDGGLFHPNWKQNFALALKLHAQLEKNTPGICRFLSFRQERFNQDLSDGAMLIEIGAAGDTLPQALRAAEHLAQAITELAWGATTDSAD